MKIAVIGGGISGLVAAWQLKELAEVTLFEANDYIGGHTHTIDVRDGDQTHAVDTGFIVFNDWTYPNFIRLLDRLGVASQESDMSFALADPASGYHYAAPKLSGLFSQKRNLVAPGHLRMIYDIFRFRTHGPAFLARAREEATLSEFFADGNYSQAFLNHYLVPMISAIWSAGCGSVGDLPARYFLHFFQNHGLMNILDRPTWRVVKGGSRSYIEPLLRDFRDRVHANTPVRRIHRTPAEVTLELPDGSRPSFDHVVLGVHSDQALKLLDNPTDLEREILGAIPYQANDVVLHTDTTILPPRRSAWASWNYRVAPETEHRAHLTYHMNRLQSLNTPRDYLVSLNQTELLDTSKQIGRYTYSHPAYSTAAVRAQARHGEISGVNRTHYCGAYWGFGFHEDGVNSALKACAWFGKGAIA